MAGALALTLAVKLVYSREPAPDADADVLGEAVAAFLLQHGFEPRVEKRGGVFVHASAGKCRMLISEAVPQGWNRNTIEWWAKPVGRLTYVFDGAVHAHEPFLVPMLDDYWRRVRVRFGLSPNRHPVLAVAASDDCAVDALPWWELAVLS